MESWKIGVSWPLGRFFYDLFEPWWNTFSYIPFRMNCQSKSTYLMDLIFKVF